MPNTIDPITHKKLVLTKQLFLQADRQVSAAPTSINRILALIGFDLATETILRAVVASLDPSKPAPDHFQGLIQQADTLLEKQGCDPIPDAAQIRHVHSLRNDAQHKAKYPNESDIGDCRTYTHDALRKIARNVWNKDFEAISLAELVQHEAVRKHLLQAEDALTQKDAKKAVECVAIALTRALSAVRQSLVGSRALTARAFQLADAFGKAEDGLDGQRMFEAFESMQGTLLYVALGMDYGDYVRFQRIAPAVIMMLDGTVSVMWRNEQVSYQDATFATAYGTDVVLQIESRAGDLDEPFGRVNAGRDGNGALLVSGAMPSRQRGHAHPLRVRAWHPASTQ